MNSVYKRPARFASATAGVCGCTGGNMYSYSGNAFHKPLSPSQGLDVVRPSALLYRVVVGRHSKALNVRRFPHGDLKGAAIEAGEIKALGFVQKRLILPPGVDALSSFSFRVDDEVEHCARRDQQATDASNQRRGCDKTRECGTACEQAGELEKPGQPFVEALLQDHVANRVLGVSLGFVKGALVRSGGWGVLLCHCAASLLIRPFWRRWRRCSQWRCVSPPISVAAIQAVFSRIRVFHGRSPLRCVGLWFAPYSLRCAAYERPPFANGGAA